MKLFFNNCLHNPIARGRFVLNSENHKYPGKTTAIINRTWPSRL